MEQIRLNKYISETGICSRREADRLIEQGKVLVNGKVGELGTKVSDVDIVFVNGTELKSKPKTIYIAFNKPIGIVCTTDLEIKYNIIHYLNFDQRIFPIGRLDKDSSGLILLTNDGDIVNKILRAENNHEKEYIVTVNKDITIDFIQKMSNGLPILDTVTKKCKVEKIDAKTFKIILTQGLNRQIRRMCEYCGYDVLKLKRIRIMFIEIGNLQIGKWRYLNDDEMKIIANL
jgi:23S rRNA pseudouridine2604 synthase